MNILFICNQGQNRSRTAAALFAGRFKTESAGLYCNKPVTRKQLAGADIIMVMEDRHRSEIAGQFPDVYLQTTMKYYAQADSEQMEKAAAVIDA